jgi:hypothetical protein
MASARKQPDRCEVRTSQTQPLSEFTIWLKFKLDGDHQERSDREPWCLALHRTPVQLGCRTKPATPPHATRARSELAAVAWAHRAFRWSRRASASLA